MIIIISYTDQTSTLLSASTWSQATAYGEGTGKDIQQIYRPTSSTELILNSPSSSNCYQISCKNTDTGLSKFYFVFEEDFQSLKTWIDSLTDSEVTNLLLKQLNYVSL
jgi:hypothetical protein